MSSSFVLDCSIAVCWCFEDEATSETDVLLDRLCDHGAIIPALWQLEVANVMVMAERRGRISAAKMVANMELLGALPFTVDQHEGRQAFDILAPLARTENLTVYDAVYLGLAMRLNLPLATKDRALLKACSRVGVENLPG